jgi:CBS domain containing-hemolysin-like protein
MMQFVTPVLIILLLIALNGLFVAAEFAIVASRKQRLEQLTDKGSSAATSVGTIISDPRNQDRFIAVAQLGITLATVGLGMYGEPNLAAWLYSPIERFLGVPPSVAHTIGTISAVAIMTYFHIVIGEMIPKALALQAPEATALAVITPMRVFGVIFRPAVMLLNSTANLFLRFLGIPSSGGEGRLHTTRELEMLVSESTEQGTLETEQQELIEAIFDFGEREVYQCMTPRPRVQGVKISASSAELSELVATSRHSRFPVYNGDLDHIIGILHIKDFIRQQSTSPEEFNLRALLRRAPRVPLHMSSENLLAAFKRLRVHMAVVMDEYGGTEGIVTLEDLLEEVVGEVYDEHDQRPLPEVQLLPDDSLLVEGEVLLEDFNELYPDLLQSEDANTIGGLIVEELGRPPEVGDTVTSNGAVLTVEDVDGLAITSVKVLLPAGGLPAPEAFEP